MTVAEDYCWTKRVETEERERLKAPRNKFSVRAATQSSDVPLKFKTTQVSPAGGMANQETISDVIANWPEGETGSMAKEVRKCIASADSVPIDRKPYTEMASQEIGWPKALGEGGDPTKLKEHGKLLNRFFHPHMPAGQSSVGMPWQPPERSRHRPDPVEEPGSQVSVVVPSELSCNASLVGSLRRSASLAAASEVSLAAPTQISLTSSQLPGLRDDAVAYLQRRGRGVARALEESNKYLIYGQYGKRYSRPLSETDATSFQAAFTKSTGGVPLHKYGR